MILVVREQQSRDPQKEHISSRDICQETQREKIRIERNGGGDGRMKEGRKIATVV